MSTITTRSGKGSPLTHNEVDANFTNLNTDKYQSGDNVTFGTATVTTFTSTGIDDNATSTAITIDSSQNVSLSGDLTVSNAEAKLYLMDNNNTDGNALLRVNGDNFGVRRVTDNKVTETNRFNLDVATGDISFYEDTGTTQAFFWDASAESLGIGTTSPSNPLNVIATNTNVLIEGSGVSSTGIAFETNNTTRASIGVANASTALSFFSDAGSTETMRIDASGNLLVGRTDAQSANNVKGCYIDAAGAFIGQRGGAASLFLNRFTSDGDIAVFRRDGTTVGSLSAHGGAVNIGNGISSLAFLPSLNTIHPNGTGSGSDGLTSLGWSNNRFKDLYLSGKLTNNGTGGINIDTSGNVGIGTTSPGALLEVNQNAENVIRVRSADGAVAGILFGDQSDLSRGSVYYDNSDESMQFRVNNQSEAMRIDSSGNLLVGQTNASTVVDGAYFRTNGSGFVATNTDCLMLNRQGTDGTVVDIRHANTTEGSISVSGTTVSYNGGHLSRWSQSDIDDVSAIYKGTVMSNLDEMCEWDNEDNEQLNKTKVSDVEGDVNVAGVFVAKDNSDDLSDYYLAMTGDMIIRIAQGTTVQRGDLLMSAGDGTAKPQDDDIVRSKTIAKVTSTNVTCTYADGSYCVPCVLMAC